MIGAFHSATTILYRMLAMHPDTTWFSQFSLRDGKIPGRRRFPLYGQIDRISRRIFEHDWNKRPETRRDSFVARPTEGQLIWQYIIPRSDSIDPMASAERLRGVLERHGHRYKKQYFLAKYPYITRHLSILRTAYPQAKFIHIVRDGRAVALSLKSWQQDQAARDYIVRDGRAIPKRELPPAETPGPVTPDSMRTAQYWLMIVNTLQAERDLIDLAEVRYEDFCEDVHRHLTALLTSVGLDVERFPFERCPKTIISTNQPRLESAPAEELEALEGILGDALRRYSYV